MDDSNTEIELKFLLPNAESVIEKLNLLATFEGEEHQIDRYYTPVHRDFLAEKPVSEWLRIRESEGKCFLTYKNFHKKEMGPKAIHCDEYETEIGNAEQLKLVFSAIDITEMVVVDKLRKIFTYKKAEISVDYVEELGYFLEIEAMKGFASIDEAREYLHDLLQELEIDVGEQDFEGYPYLLLRKRGLV